MMRPAVALALRTMRPPRIPFAVLLAERECFYMGVKNYLRILLGALPHIIDRSEEEEEEMQFKLTFLRDPRDF